MAVTTQINFPPPDHPLLSSDEAVGVLKIPDWHTQLELQGSVNKKTLQKSKEGEFFALLDRTLLSVNCWRRVFVIRLPSRLGGGFLIYDDSFNLLNEPLHDTPSGHQSFESFMNDYTDDGTWYYKTPTKPRSRTERTHVYPTKKGLKEAPDKAEVEAPDEEEVETIVGAGEEAPDVADVEAPDEAVEETEVEEAAEAEVEEAAEAEEEAVEETEVEEAAEAEVEAPAEAEEEAPAEAEVEAPAEAEEEAPDEAEVELPAWVCDSATFQITLSDGALYGGMIASISYNKRKEVLLALDDACWMPISRAAFVGASISPRDSTSGLVAGQATGMRKVASITYGSAGEVSGMLMGPSDDAVLGDSGCKAYLAHYPFAPADDSDILRTRFANKRREHMRAFANGDIVQAGTARAAVVRYIYKAKTSRDQARYLLLLFEVNLPAGSDPPRKDDPAPQFFPATPSHWSRVPASIDGWGDADPLSPLAPCLTLTPFELRQLNNLYETKVWTKAYGVKSLPSCIRRAGKLSQFGYTPYYSSHTDDTTSMDDSEPASKRRRKQAPSRKKVPPPAAKTSKSKKPLVLDDNFGVDIESVSEFSELSATFGKKGRTAQRQPQPQPMQEEQALEEEQPQMQTQTQAQAQAETVMSGNNHWCGQPMTMGACGQPMMSACGQPMMSACGQPMMMGACGQQQPMMMGACGQPMMMGACGQQPMMMGACGQPMMMGACGQQQPMMMGAYGSPMMMGACRQQPMAYSGSNDSVNSTPPKVRQAAHVHRLRAEAQCRAIDLAEAEYRYRQGNI